MIIKNDAVSVCGLIKIRGAIGCWFYRGNFPDERIDFREGSVVFHGELRGVSICFFWFINAVDVTCFKEDNHEQSACDDDDADDHSPGDVGEIGLIGLNFYDFRSDNGKSAEICWWIDRIGIVFIGFVN